MTSVALVGALVGAGVAAGTVGTAGGITSLISYPALLLAGVSPIAANATNIVALVACWPGSALASRPELTATGPWLRRWIPVAAAGGAAGAGLLLLTPAGAFARGVPVLVLLASLGLFLQPVLTRRRAGRDRPVDRVVRRLGLPATMVYNGYFGAGAGIMTLALLLITVDARLPAANALKNMLIGAATLASGVVLAATGTVDWRAAAPLAVGMLAGSTLGPRVARRLPPGLLRTLMALTGLGLALGLWLTSS